jgi:hypothetical protein
MLTVAVVLGKKALTSRVDLHRTSSLRSVETITRPASMGMF